MITSKTKSAATICATSFLAAGVALAAASASCLADVVTLDAAADNTIFLRPGFPELPLSSGLGDGIFTGRTWYHATFIQRGLVRFDLSGIPCGSTITSATLTLTVDRAPRGQPDTQVLLHRVLGSWGEGDSDAYGGVGDTSQPGDANWTYRVHPDVPWNNAGGDFDPTASAAAGVPSEVGQVNWSGSSRMLSDIRMWINSPETNAGWILINDEQTQATARKFASRQHPTASARPKLVVEFTPRGLPGGPCACSAADIAGGGPTGLQPDGTVDGNDFVAFINSFALGDPAISAIADLAGGGPDGNLADGVIDGTDFVAFINAFAIGC